MENNKMTSQSNMLEDLKCARLNQSELQRKCLESMFKVWVDFIPHDFPVKCNVILDHEKIPKDDRKQFDSKYYKEKPEILEYYSKEMVIFWRNKGCLEWLESTLEFCKTKDELDKLKNRIEKFRNQCEHQGFILRIKGYETKDPCVMGVINEFKGKVV